MKILIVEDEQKIADYIRQGLAENGFVVDVAGQGDDGLHAARTGGYDLIILTDGLPAGSRGPSIRPEFSRRLNGASSLDPAFPSPIQFQIHFCILPTAGGPSSRAASVRHDAQPPPGARRNHHTSS